MHLRKSEGNFVRFPGTYSQHTNAAWEALGLQTEHRRHSKRGKWGEELLMEIISTQKAGPDTLDRPLYPRLCVTYRFILDGDDNDRIVGTMTELPGVRP